MSWLWHLFKNVPDKSGFFFVHITVLPCSLYYLVVWYDSTDVMLWRGVNNVLVQSNGDVHVCSCHTDCQYAEIVVAV